MLKGFMQFEQRELEVMIELEYGYRDLKIHYVSVEVHNEFSITVTVYETPDNRAYSYNALSDFNHYSGDAFEIDAKATHLLFNDIIKDASIELEII